jgi:mono/diheme cytochrome c family protein
LLLASSAAGVQNPSIEGKPVKNPFPYTRKSIEAGKQIYLRHCVQCHDFDGRSLSGRDFAAAPPKDLTYPQEWLHGTSEGEIFKSNKEGTKEEMPPYKDKLKDEEIWHLVNFVRSLWPEDLRPKESP